METTDSPLNEITVFLAKVRDAVVLLVGGTVAGICNFSGELVKAGGEAAVCGLHAVLTVMWQKVPPYWKRGFGHLCLKKEKQDCMSYHRVSLLSVPPSAHLYFAD